MTGNLECAKHFNRLIGQRRSVGFVHSHIGSTCVNTPLLLSSFVLYTVARRTLSRQCKGK